MKKVHYYILLLVAGFSVAALSSCMFNCVRGSGHPASETRKVAEFTKLDISGDFNIILKQDSSLTLDITADDNLLKFIKTKIGLGLFGVLLVSCDVKGTDFVVHMSYEFEDESCTTGSHKFTSEVSNEDLYKKFCKDLSNNALNNNCAEQKRRYNFEYYCANSNLNLKWPVSRP